MRRNRNKATAALPKFVLVALALAWLAALAACSPGGAGAGGDKIQVVATTNIVAEWSANIGGDRVEVFSLVPVGADPHSYQPGAKDVARVADGQLVLSVGLELEGDWLEDLLQNAARDPSSIVEMGEVVDPIEFGVSHAGEVVILEEISHVVHEVEDGEISPKEGLEELEELLAKGYDKEEAPEMALEIIGKVENGRMEAGGAIEAIAGLISEAEDEHAGHGHGLEDPHFWFDPLRVKLAVDHIAARLSALDPAGADTFDANAASYKAELEELHSWTIRQFIDLPEERRVIVTSHDSFQYFAQLYGFEVVGTVLSARTTEVEPSAERLTRLVELVREHRVPAIFGETTVSERLAASIATETGAELVRLYSGSLGAEGSGAETFIDMIRTNVGRIAEALR